MEKWGYERFGSGVVGGERKEAVGEARKHLHCCGLVVMDLWLSFSLKLTRTCFMKCWAFSLV